MKVSDAISVDLNEVRLKQISDKLIELSQNADVKSEYEFLCDVIKNDFKESLMEKSKQIRETISFIIKKDDMNFTCEISKDSKEIDSVGMEKTNNRQWRWNFISGRNTIFNEICGVQR